MKKFKVLIADAQNEVRRQLVKALKDDQSIEIVGETDNGKEAYELYTDHNPDIVLFELLLPVYDGYTLLEKMQQSAKNSKTMYIIITSINKDILISEALNRGVNYVIMKPFDCNIMAEKIKKVYLRMNEILKENKSMLDYNTDDLSICAKSGTIPQMDTIISNKLNEIGVPARLKGYRYMITAVKEVISNEDALEGVTKVLYPDVAKKHNSTPQRVEKAIRHAIEVALSVEDAYNNGSKDKYSVRYKKGRPTNSEFIAQISREIRQSA